MSGYGFPDWQSSANVRSSLLLRADNVTASTVNNTVGTVTLGNYAYLAISIPTLINANVVLSLQWKDDVGTGMGIQNFLIRPLLFIQFPLLVPAIGASCTIVVAAAAGPTATLAIHAWGYNAPYSITGVSDNVLASSATPAVAVGATATTVIDSYTGPATVWAQSVGQAILVRVVGRDINGNAIARTFFGSIGTTGELAATGVWLGPYLNEIQVVNNGTGASTLSAMVMSQIWTGH